MDFSLSEEQLLIKESVEKFVTKDYTFDNRETIRNSEAGYSTENWQLFAEMGWLGLTIPEEYGGFGGNALDTAILMEAFGSAMLLEPYFSTAVLGVNTLIYGGSEAQKKTHLQAVADGGTKLALAYAEKGSRYQISNIQMSAKKSGDNYILNGEKVLVLGGASADQLIVAARTSGEQTDEYGISLFLVDAKASGVAVTGYQTMDGGRAAHINLTGVEIAATNLIGTEGEGFALLERVLDEATIALCAQALGNMVAVQQKTLEYLKTRKQFGVPIGVFQVLQFRAVDMFMKQDLSRSMLYMAVLELSKDDADARRKAASGAKAFIGEQARSIAQEGVQLHGGVGMTEELDIGHYFRSLTQFCTQFGSTDHHLKRFAELG